MQKAHVERRLYRIPEAAALLAISEPCLRKWVARGVIAGVKIQGVLRIDHRDLDELIERARFRRPPG